MALERALEELLEGIRAEIIALRQVKHQIKADLAQERGEDVTKSRSDSFRTFLEEVSKEVFKDERATERALILADAVSYEIWGGARGWERATDAEFDILVNKLKEKLRAANTDECVPPVRREGE